MPKTNYWAIVAAAIAAVVIGVVWYIVFGEMYMKLRGIDPSAMANMKVSVWEVLGEFVRYLVVARVLAYFIVRLGVVGWKSGAQLGLYIWVGFQATLLIGAVIHEGMPMKLYAIHAGDALVKVVLIAVMLSVWPRQELSVASPQSRL